MGKGRCCLWIQNRNCLSKYIQTDNWFCLPITPHCVGRVGSSSSSSIIPAKALLSFYYLGIICNTSKSSLAASLSLRLMLIIIIEGRRIATHSLWVDNKDSFFIFHLLSIGQVVEISAKDVGCQFTNQNTTIRLCRDLQFVLICGRFLLPLSDLIKTFFLSLERQIDGLEEGRSRRRATMNDEISLW